MTRLSVQAEKVGKKFGLSLRSALKYGLIDSGRRLTGRSSDHDLRPDEFWALHNISFSLEPGDALGIMGVNGSGKTTLLRILNGTYSPDAGRITLKGRIGALIAAGAGFSPMLSGRENIYISGTLLGLKPNEIRQKFDEIVEFSELGDFIDMPIRNYSSGMNVRLGFAIAVVSTPEILLIDEVLAVGDLNFQKKCFERIEHLKRIGTTVLLVSHAPGAIWSVCNKGMLINKGLSQGIISVEDACRAYDHVNMQSRLASSVTTNPKDYLPNEYGGKRGGTGDILVTNIEILDEARRVTKEIDYGKSFTIRIYLDAKIPFNDLIFRVQVDSEINKAIAILDSYESNNSLFTLSAGEHILELAISSPNLRPGVYEFSPSLSRKAVGVHLFFQYSMASVMVRHPLDKFLYADFRASTYLESNFLVL